MCVICQSALLDIVNVDQTVLQILLGFGTNNNKVIEVIEENYFCRKNQWRSLDVTTLLLRVAFASASWQAGDRELVQKLQ